MAKFHNASGFIGGTPNQDIDAITGYSDGDPCKTIVSGIEYLHQYDASESGAESSPDIIIPDDNSSGTGAWVLRKYYLAPIYLDRVNGRIGIGDATAPDEVLHIEDADATIRFLIESGTGSALFKLISASGSYAFSARNDSDLVHLHDYTTSETSISFSGANAGVGGYSGYPASGKYCLVFYNGVKGSSGVANASYIYAKDVSNKSELFTVDEDNNETQQTSHRNDLIPDSEIAAGWDDPMFWSFSHTIPFGDMEITETVNMQKLVILVEQLTGEKLIYRKINKTQMSVIEDRIKEQKIKNYISEQSKTIDDDTGERVNEIEVSKQDALETVESDEKYIDGEVDKYKLVNGEVVTIKKPNIKTRKTQKIVLKKYHRFCSETGKFFKCQVPTEKEAKAHVEAAWQYDKDGTTWKIAKCLDYLDKMKRLK